MRKALRVSLTLCLFLLCVLRASVANPQVTPVELRIGFARPGGGYTMTTMPLDTYVARVLAGEAARDSPPAALEALAITVRTYALANRDRHRADGFDLCDDTHCQVVRAATSVTDRAARATAGQILTRNGVVASVYYGASCGGRTEMPSNVWPRADDPPYLPSADDDACAGAPAWTAELSDGDLLRAFHASGFRGDRLRDMRVLSRNQSGRVARLKLDGLVPDEVSGQDLRVAVGRTLGWQYVKSTLFDLRRQDGTYRFAGHGSGHGVGLCVIGSVNLAARGASAASILGRYFPGTTITAVGPRLPPNPPRLEPAPNPPRLEPAPSTPRPTPAPSSPRPTPASPDIVSREPSDLLLSLPDGDEGERKAIAQLTARARDDLARTLGVMPPARMTVRFHPTTDDYERATSQPWFTSGAVVSAEVHLLPLAVLRERGVLERTVRHELVHLMADAILDRRPAWVREGAAIYFAGEPAIPGEAAPRGPAATVPQGGCPSDAELLQPVSVGALTSAYARARACFARQIEAGRSWRDVR
jgi:SpoIID/LytB domain protein